MTSDFKLQVARLRPGDAVEVESLADLANDRGTLSELRDRLTAIHDKGCYVLEKSTGRKSNTPRVGDMIFDAAKRLKKGLPSKVAKDNGRKGGRPPKVRETPKDMAELHWFNSRHRTDDDALIKMKGWTKSAAWRTFGPSGRPHRGRPKSKKR
jgi:hypothetical protein